MISIRKSPEPASCFTAVVIDDDGVARFRAHRNFETILKVQGINYQLHQAESGNAGQKLVQTLPSIHFALVDFHLGDMLGTTLSTELLEKHPSATVVLFSASPRPEIDKAGCPAGVEVILEKNHKLAAATLQKSVEVFRATLQSRKNSSNGDKG